MLTAALLALAGCPGSLNDPGSYDLEAGADVTPACGDVPSTVFAPRCTLSVCHGAATPAAGLDLSSPDVYARLAGKVASGGPGMLVDPSGNPTTSVLYLKLTSKPPFGAQMPLTGAKLDPASLACVASWITSQGAACDAAAPAPDGSGLDGAGPAFDGSPSDATAPFDASASDTGEAPDGGTKPDTSAAVEDAGRDGPDGVKDGSDDGAAG